MSTYEKRVRELEAEGCTRSDAQAVADAELAKQAQPTPGPWRVIITVNRHSKVATDRGKMLIDTEFSGAHYGEDCANVRLIAAAPDLLKALRIIQQRCIGTRYANKTGLACINAIAEAAIAKATGKS